METMYDTIRMTVLRRFLALLHYVVMYREYYGSILSLTLLLIEELYP